MSDPEELIELSDDELDNLLPTENFKLGTREITLRPLVLEDWPPLISSIQKILLNFVSNGISQNNWEDRLPHVFSILLENAPEVLEKVSGISRNTLKRMPTEPSIELFTKCLRLNIQDRERLAKNLEALLDQIGSLSGNPKMAAALAGQYSSLSKSEGTPGEISSAPH